MEAPELTSMGYWESGSVDLRLNPRREVEAGGLLDFLQKDCGVKQSVVLATSGSTGGFKFVILSKPALLASAHSVVSHCGMDEEDVFLAGLSGFHVGGLGIFARACNTQARLVDISDQGWDRKGEVMVASIREHGVTQTSLTPTHLYDLVRHGVEAPDSLRCVLLGGGRMDPRLIAEARALGWPVRVSYGMTEASSQIATAGGDEIEWLPVLDCWNVRVGEDKRLSIRGEPLFTGYATRDENGWSFDSGKDSDGWFLTGDHCEVRDGSLRFLGRADDLVKTSGEFVSVSEVDSRVASLAREAGYDAAILAGPDERRGMELILVLETRDGNAAELFEGINQRLPGIEKASRWVCVEELPRTSIGKLDRAALDDLVRE